MNDDGQNGISLKVEIDRESGEINGLITIFGSSHSFNSFEKALETLGDLTTMGTITELEAIETAEHLELIISNNPRQAATGKCHFYPPEAKPLRDKDHAHCFLISQKTH